MNNIIPKKLNHGDEIRIIAPSRSMKMLSEKEIDIAKKRLEKLGFKVTFGKNVNNIFDEDYYCASIKDRIEDLHNAFKDKNVKAIITVKGGYNTNQLLNHIDYDLIKNNPKILCGYSDITALLNAIYTKTGLITYYGPNFTSFCNDQYKYTLDYFKKTFVENEEIELKDSKIWSDKNNIIKNEGRIIINKGNTFGNIIAGNLCTLNLLQGTEYIPKIDNIILFIEDTDIIKDEFLRTFDRNLQALLHYYKKINALIIGRTKTSSNMTKEKWEKMLKNKKELKNIPIIINMDFGHTNPMFIIPIGGQTKIKNDKIIINNEV